MKQQSHPGGRPTKYNTAICDRVRDLCLLGATDKQLAEILEINIDTLYEWKKRHPEFSDALKNGKEAADAEVVKSLYKRAIGFGEGDKYYPPDPTSCIFWLKNRRREYWRDKQDLEHTGKDGESLNTAADPTEVARSLAFILNQAIIKGD